MKQTPKLNFEFEPFRIENTEFLGTKSRRRKSENRQVLRVGGPARPPARRSDLEKFIFLVYRISISGSVLKTSSWLMIPNRLFKGI